MTEPGNEMAAGAGGGESLSLRRDQVTRALKAALVQGRLTEDEYGERMCCASAAGSRAELTALTADLPVGRMDVPPRPPRAKDVRIGVSVSLAAAGVAAAILLGQPDNPLAFVAFIFAAVTLLVAPILTAGVMVDVWRQKRSGRQRPPWPSPDTGGTPSPRPASAAPAGPRPPIDRGRQHAPKRHPQRFISAKTPQPRYSR